MASVAILQMVTSSSIKENLHGLHAYFEQAKALGAALIVLPENFAFMGMNEKDKLTVAETYGMGEIQQAIHVLAKQHCLWVIAGTIPIKHSNHQVKASCLVYDDHGVCVARYDKIHLFDVTVSEHETHQESLTIQRGQDIVVVDTPIGRVGLSVCYDVRFPELYRQLVMKGAEILSIPSAFTSATGMAHWEILLRARAIENLCYVVAANQGGLHQNGRTTYGHSMIIEPWGKIIAEHPSGPGLLVADIDLDRVRQLRHQFPCHEHHVINS